MLVMKTFETNKLFAELKSAKIRHVRYVDACLKEAGIDAWAYTIAGNALNSDKPNDYDLFQIELKQNNSSDWQAGHDPIGVITRKLPKADIIKTKNAVTWKSKAIQFCRYGKYSTLQELVESFDFSHCQIGLRVENGEIVDVAMTGSYIDARVLETTRFTGSEYPLSSLIRLQKCKGMLSQKAFKRETLQILKCILQRGFRDYEDFLHQLDAIDLQYIEGVTKEDVKGSFDRLFDEYRREMKE